PLIKSWRFCDHPDMDSKMDPRSPPGAQSWQHFEQFVATFRCLRSRVISEGKETSVKEVHRGARLNGDLVFNNHHLELEFSSGQVDTKSTGYSMDLAIPTEHNNVHVREGRHCIVNGQSAPYGDSFLGLDTDPFRMEVHQCKLTTSGDTDYLVERTKAASEDDFFILFTSKDRLNVELPPLSGIVDGSNWKEYFGPFAGKAFIFATVGALDINTATRKDLKRMRGIGKKIAQSIIGERTKKYFESLEDACERLPKYRRLLRDFNYPHAE
ncbi:hypothetical protein BGX20_004293, partial [Mortierella sp. AD010]